MSLVGRNMTWLLLSQVATWVLSLFVAVAVPRLLGAELLGTYNVTVAYVGFFTLAAGLGTSILMTREIARDRSILGVYVYNAVGLKLVVVALLSTLALGLAVLLPFTDEMMILVAIGCVGMLIFVLNEVTFSTLSGLQRMGRASVWQVISVYVASIGGILVLAGDGTVVTYAIVMTGATIIPLLATAAIVWPMVRPEDRRLDLGVWRHLIRAGVPLMMLTVFNQIYNTVDVPILGAIAGLTTVGWYGVAYRWAGIPIFIATAVVGSHYPEMSIHGKTGGPPFVALVNRAVKITLLASIPAAVGLAVIAPDLISWLYPNGEYDNSVRPLQILALQIPITSMDTVLATALIASDRLRKYLVVAGFAAALNPIMCIVLINVALDAWDNGAIGTALATATTELFVMSCALYLSARGVMNRSMVSWTARCILASLTIVAVGLLAGAGHVTVQVVLGVVAFGVAALVFRVVSPAMVRQGFAQGRRVVGGVRSRVGGGRSPSG